MLGRSSLAIDVGTSSVKVLDLAGRKAPRVRAVGLEPLPFGAIKDGVIQDEPAVERIVRSLLTRLRVRTAFRSVAVSVGGDAVRTACIQTEARSTVELAQEVYYTAEQTLGLDMAAVYFDYIVLGPSDERRVQNVLVVAARREIVDQRRQLMRRLGLYPKVVDADVVSLCNTLEHSYGVTDTPLLLLDCKTMRSTVSIVLDGVPVYINSIPVGGETYTEAVMTALSVDRDTAESMKVGASLGGGVPSEVQRCIAETHDRFLEALAANLRDAARRVDIPLTSARALEVGYLGGGGALTLGLDAALAAALRMRVSALQPFQHMSLRESSRGRSVGVVQPHFYAVAAGLGARSLCV